MRCTFQIDTSTHLRVPFSMGLWVPVLYHVSLNHLSITSHQTSWECERSALWRKDILGLMRLDKRRDRSDLIETFKILNGNYRVDKDLFFVPDDGGRRGHSRKLFKRRCGLDIKKFAFSNRIVDNWNSLSENCVRCTTLNNFKSHIRLHWDWNQTVLYNCICMADAILTTVVYDDAYFPFSRRLISYLWHHLSNVI